MRKAWREDDRHTRGPQKDNFYRDMVNDFGALLRDSVGFPPQEQPANVEGSEAEKGRGGEGHHQVRCCREGDLNGYRHLHSARTWGEYLGIRPRIVRTRARKNRPQPSGGSATAAANSPCTTSHGTWRRMTCAAGWWPTSTSFASLSRTKLPSAATCAPSAGRWTTSACQRCDFVAKRPSPGLIGSNAYGGTT